MNTENLKKIETEAEFVALLKKHNLFREDDVTFDDLSEGNLYMYTGDDFRVAAEVIEPLEVFALLVVGDVDVELLRVGDILQDFGVFCVTGNVKCKDFHCATESTGVSIGGELEVTNIFYADCGNSVVYVNGDLRAKLLFNSQCSIEVAGEETFQFDERIDEAGLKQLGLGGSDAESADEVVSSYFDQYDD